MKVTRSRFCTAVILSRLRWVAKNGSTARPITPQNFKELLKEEVKKEKETGWKACEALCGTVMRPGVTNTKTSKLAVIARTYTEESAAKRLSLPVQVIRDAVKDGALPFLVDPEHRIRIPAGAVETAAVNAPAWEKIAGYEVVKTRHISLVSGLSFSTVRSRLRKAGFSPSAPTWGQVRGMWGLPESLKEFHEIAEERFPIWLKSVIAEKEAALWEMGGNARKEFQREREERDSLRQKLFEMFPTWDGHDRQDQHVTLHLGPTNSGKTFQGISQLMIAGSGWYLAPLRLLAHEIFDTLNKNGVACNLLTGEESIEVDGARITAATIEMFDPRRSGDCVIIDEAHMLSDSQRGWAWTRAIMETDAPEVHIIGAPVVENLIRRMTSEIGVDIEVENYLRLTPLDVAHKPWNLASLPSKTILVAFSRKMVLGLKSELEKVYHRSVSVVYGNLPPEVRLNQAERFASGSTEICVATDAIGMGLNLPADNVCFFETKKFDGNEVRGLTVNEIRQIGGRAGRYGLSNQGLIGALNRSDLLDINNAINSGIADIEFAHVAPAPESISLMPGSLSEKLQKWVELSGIPPRWKEMLRPVDLTSQIELAKMLTPRDVRKLGEEVALLLINAPCNQDSQNYWLQCAKAIINEEDMPVVVNPVRGIKSAADLEIYEIAIRCADIYLWLIPTRALRAVCPGAGQHAHQAVSMVDGRGCCLAEAGRHDPALCPMWQAAGCGLPFQYLQPLLPGSPLVSKQLLLAVLRMTPTSMMAPPSSIVSLLPHNPGITTAVDVRLDDLVAFDQGALIGFITRLRPASH